ncbi:MAG: glycoside hydrolase family 3 C-terminal domain-containing protein [Bacteroidales bacterium]|nr:glycoside hydrolase family 3 C-terminal domain-containing protein [Bacteroidales bacterium]
MKVVVRPLIIWLFVLSSSLASGQALTAEQKADSLLDIMTLDEKIGQMAQAERGALENLSDISYYNLGSLLSGGGSTPYENNVTAWADMYDTYQEEALKSGSGIPLIYGIDAVHGHNNVHGAVIFPHNIGLGCTRNTELVKNINIITATEVAATGIDWTFSPCIAVPRDERWGRTYEGFGETPGLQSMMAGAAVSGLQGSDLSLPTTILACAKHYVGDGGTTDGIDQGNTVLTEQELRSVHMAGYIDAINKGTGTIMASYNSWNGDKLHGHEYLLTDVLKGELGFDGFIISDWKGVDQVDEDYRTAVKRAINAGIDMVMVPDRYIYFISILKDLVENNEVPESRINDAVRRILIQKFKLKLFEKPMTDRSLISSVGSAEHRATARQAVRESLVLLSARDNALPLKKDGQKILLAGKRADDIGAQCGGWTISWQGSNGDITEGTTILEGLQEINGSNDIIYSPTGVYDGDADIAVVVIGEDPYAEGAGDRESLRLDRSDVNMVRLLKEEGKKVITILISGRPMIIGDVLPYSDAFIAAWLPGTEGSGIADILFGDHEPAGKLNHSWPAYMEQIPVNYGDSDYNPLYSYGHGIDSFPVSVASTGMRAVAAASNREGTSIMLKLTGKISSMNVRPDNFSVSIDNEEMPGMAGDIIIPGYDSSMIEIVLNRNITEEDTVINLGYNGGIIESASGNLEEFTGLFVFNSYENYGTAIPVPGRVEAEDYFEMQGIDTENCTDQGGGLNVGWIDPGDRMKYYLDIHNAGLYRITGRISGYNAGTLSLVFNDTLTAGISFTSTGGWQSWQDFSTSVYLDSNKYVMEARAGSNGYNINYFDFGLYGTGINDISNSIDEINIFPNPFDSHFTLQFNSEQNQPVTIKIYDMQGRLIRELYDGPISRGSNSISFDTGSHLQEGLYFIEIKNEKRRFFKKIVKS